MTGAEAMQLFNTLRAGDTTTPQPAGVAYEVHRYAATPVECPHESANVTVGIGRKEDY